MDDLDNHCCPNKECSQHGIRGGKNIRVRALYGEQKTRLLYCTKCKQRFSENHGTVFHNSRLPKETVVSILEHVVEGNGMRKTGRLLRVRSETVSRYTRLAGDHAEKLHNELVEFSPRNTGGSVRRKVGLRAKEGKTVRGK